MTVKLAGISIFLAVSIAVVGSLNRRYKTNFDINEITQIEILVVPKEVFLLQPLYSINFEKAPLVSHLVKGETFSQSLYLGLGRLKKTWPVFKRFELDLVCKIHFEDGDPIKMGFPSNDKGYVLVGRNYYKDPGDLFSLIIDILPEDYDRMNSGFKFLNFDESTIENLIRK